MKSKADKKPMSTGQKGDYGLSIAIRHFIETGHTVAIPISDTQTYDLIVDKTGSVPKKVEVKYTSYKIKSGVYEVSFFSGRKIGTERFKKEKYTNSFDYLFIVCEDGRLYSIPSYVLSMKRKLRLTDRYKEFQI